MAGTNHHILPKFLLNGFACRTEKKGKKTQAFVWWYRNGFDPRETNTDKINVEQHFYGTDDKLNVDPAITELEGGFSKVIVSLRDTPELTDISSSGIIEFIAHLTSRTRHLRESIVDSTDVLFTEMESYYADETNGRAFIRDHFQRHPEILREKVNEVIASLPGSRKERRFVGNRLKRLSNSTLVNKIEQDFPEFFTTQVHEQLLAFKQVLPTLAKEGHIKIMAKSLIPVPKVEAYRNLKWTVRDSPIPLILGDVGCLFVVDGYDKWISLDGPNETIRHAYLPISPSKLVIGTLDDFDEKNDFATINLNQARRSREFFIADSYSKDLLELNQSLATDTRILSDEEIQTIIREAANDS